MINANISPREKECLHKRVQRSWWSPEMQLKVQQYDRNRKRLQSQQTREDATPSVSERKQKIKCKVSIQHNENGFKKSVKKLFTVGLKSPKKKEFLLQYCEEHGMKVECGGVKSESECKSDKTVYILQLKAFNLQNRVEDHRKLVERIKHKYGSLNKAAKALNIHYCTFWEFVSDAN